MISVTAALSEFVAQAIFVFTCTGAATGTASAFNRNTDAPDFQGDDVQAALPVPFVQTVALTFGLTITVLAYATGNKSGAQINGAVTLGLAAAGELAPVQAVVNICAQLLGSMLGSGLLSLVVRKGSDRTGGLGTNAVARGYSPRQAFLGEAIMVFVLMYTVLETACNKKNKANLALAPIAIGFAVYIGHTILIPIDGCSINPTRSFGPAVLRPSDIARRSCLCSKFGRAQVVATIQDRGGQHFKHFWVSVRAATAVTNHTGSRRRRGNDADGSRAEVLPSCAIHVVAAGGVNSCPRILFRPPADGLVFAQVFVIGPVTGALVAVAYYKFINQLQDSESEPEAEPKKVEKVEDRSEKV